MSTTALQGDLVSKTFLFIGFSFDDPNLKQVLSRIRVLLGENCRPHYFFVKQLTINECRNEEEFKYKQHGMELQIADLLRYSIHAVRINEFSEISTILSRIKVRVNTQKIFIAGSSRNYGSWSKKDAYDFLYTLDIH